MTSEECITIIKDRLLNLINSGQLKATFRPSDSTFSFYYNDIDIGERPLLTLRLANHNPQYQHYIHPELTPPSEGYNMNISIEFYKPKLKRNGRIKRNRINPNVTVPEDIHGVVPFVVNSYEYIPEKLDEEDIDKIYENILAWIYNDFNIDYNDPLKGTDKEAYSQSKIANITWNISHNISVDNEGNHQSAYGHGADYVSESKNIYKYNQNNCNRNMKNKKVVRLTESQLHNIIAESVNRVLRENYNCKKRKLYEMWNKRYDASDDEIRSFIDCADGRFRDGTWYFQWHGYGSDRSISVCNTELGIIIPSEELEERTFPDGEIFWKTPDGDTFYMDEIEESSPNTIRCYGSRGSW